MAGQATNETPTSQRQDVTLSVDAMGGDSGPLQVIKGISRFLRETSGCSIVVCGPQEQLAPLIARHRLGPRVSVSHAPEIVQMSDRPSQAMRNGRETSMWAAVESVRSGEADVCVSCGNTGALMAISMLRLRKLDGVKRPAIACMWPSRNAGEFNIMLDAGADVRADEEDLLTYALMGASYARNGLGLNRPRIGLLNVGVEEHKGRAELKVAHELIARAAPLGQFDYLGFVEGTDLPTAKVDVVVTDGFTGNVALKTAEGTARLISELTAAAFKHSPLSRVAALMAMTSLRRLHKRIDPRHVNGGVFLGLNGTVIKSHGSADSRGVAAALRLSHQLAQKKFGRKLASRVASIDSLAADSMAPATLPVGD